MLFGKNLREHRKNKGLTQSELAQIVGVSRQAIASYEGQRREPSFEVLIKLANCFCVSIDKLIGRDEHSIINNTETIKENVLKLKGDLSLEDFCKEVGRKTGFAVTKENLDLNLSSLQSFDKILLKILSMYAGVEVEALYGEDFLN